MTYILVFCLHGAIRFARQADATAGADIHPGGDREVSVGDGIVTTCTAGPSSCCSVGRIEIELGDGSRVRVDDGVSLVTLRRVISALRG